MSAAMAEYNPFAERASMLLVALQPPSRKVIRIGETPKALGFDLQLLASEKQVLDHLERLKKRDVAALHCTFKRNVNPRIIKQASGKSGVPYGKTRDCAHVINCADLTKLAKLIKIVAA